MSRKLSAEYLAKEAVRVLKTKGDARVAARTKSYFKPDEKIVVYGVSTPSLRTIERDLYRVTRGQWEISQAIKFCEIMIHKPHVEARALGILLLSRYKKEFTREMLDRAEEWLLDDCCNNWALTDTLSPLIISRLLDQFPDLLTRTKRWVKSDNLWLRRAAVVSLIPRVRNDECLDAAYMVARSLFADREDLIHKATGWLLREAGKRDSHRLEAFLRSNGSKIPRTALRYALERFPAQTRQQILASTRSRLPAASKRHRK